jgi:hypothetical protein
MQATFANQRKNFDPKLTLYVATVAAVGTLTSPLPLAVGDMKVSVVATAETIAITASTDGVNYSATLLPFDLSTGLDHATGALATGNYVLPYRLHSQFQFFKFTKSGAVNPSSVAVVRMAQVP